jgi:Fe-S-cluster containining protein
VKCGLCCKILQHIPVLSEYDIGYGVCRYLLNNLCSIYEDRPQICNIEEMYISCFKEIIAENEFITLNLEACIQIAEYFSDEEVKQKLIKAKNNNYFLPTSGVA